MSNSGFQSDRDFTNVEGQSFDSIKINVTLTNRELKVLTLCAEGLSSKEIGNKLHISFETVRIHRKKIIIKMNAKNITESVAIAIRKGII